jgi:succinyl-CoA synthetase beta subunit
VDLLEYHGKQLFARHGIPAEAPEANGVRVGRTPTEVAEIAISVLTGRTLDAPSVGAARNGGES